MLLEKFIFWKFKVSYFLKSVNFSIKKKIQKYFENRKKNDQKDKKRTW